MPLSLPPHLQPRSKNYRSDEGGAHRPRIIPKFLPPTHAHPTESCCLQRFNPGPPSGTSQKLALQAALGYEVRKKRQGIQRQLRGPTLVLLILGHPLGRGPNSEHLGRRQQGGKALQPPPLRTGLSGSLCSGLKAKPWMNRKPSLLYGGCRGECRGLHGALSEGLGWGERFIVGGREGRGSVSGAASLQALLGGKWKSVERKSRQPQGIF